MKEDKLKTLAEIEGFSKVMEMLEEFAVDAVVPGICMNEGCEYSTGVEPDCENGICENCDENTVTSCLILAEII